jgi:hypothetical protein
MKITKFSRAVVLSPGTKTRSISLACKLSRASGKIKVIVFYADLGNRALFVPGQKTLERQRGTPGGVKNQKSLLL